MEVAQGIWTKTFPTQPGWYWHHDPNRRYLSLVLLTWGRNPAGETSREPNTTLRVGSGYQFQLDCPADMMPGYWQIVAVPDYPDRKNTEVASSETSSA